jgi:hypothetical protein
VSKSNGVENSTDAKLIIAARSKDYGVMLFALTGTPAEIAVLGAVFIGSWFAWMPIVALLEYTTHRWIMHTFNRWLDPKQIQLRSHGAHHQGVDNADFIDMPVRNCILLTAPLMLVTLCVTAVTGAWAIGIAVAMSLLAWCFFYAWAWTVIHRAIHETGAAWFRRTGPLFRYYYDHHMGHHDRVATNFGTVFPMTDYLFGTVSRASAAEVRETRRRKAG